MRRTLLYCNLFWLLFSLVVCVEAYRLKLGAINDPGSGFFPFCVGLVMLGLSLAALFQSMGKKNEAEKTFRLEPLRWWNIVIILAAIAAYALTLEKVGFLVNTFVFIGLLLKVVEPQPWKTAILGALITTISANLVFNVIFRAQIPSGIFGF
jgi:putative tricarboxylic transport membrane protein